jgi:hypothetical protein
MKNSPSIRGAIAKFFACGVIALAGGGCKDKAPEQEEEVIEIQQKVFQCILDAKPELFGSYNDRTIEVVPSASGYAEYDPRRQVVASVLINGVRYQVAAIDFKGGKDGESEAERDTLLIGRDGALLEDKGVDGELDPPKEGGDDRYKAALEDLDALCSGTLAEDPIFSINPEKISASELYDLLKRSEFFNPQAKEQGGFVETPDANTTILLLDDTHGSPEVEMKQIQALHKVFGDSLVIGLEGYAEDSTLVNAEAKLVTALVNDENFNTVGLEEKETQLLALKWCYLLSRAQHKEAMRDSLPMNRQLALYEAATLQREELEKAISGEINNDEIIEELKTSPYAIDVNLDNFEWGNADDLLVDARNKIAVGIIVKTIQEFRAKHGPEAPLYLTIVMGQAHGAGLRDLVLEKINDGLKTNFIRLRKPF